MALRSAAGAALGLLLGLLARPAAAAPACPPVKPQVRVSISDPEPRLSTAFGIDALHAKSGRPRSANVHHLALTSSRVEWEGEIDARTATGRGGVCARPERVVLTLAQTEHLIRIAREIRRGSCLFREVEAHERRHVAVNRRTLRAAAARARKAAIAWAATAEGRGATEREAVAALQRGLRHAIERTVGAMRAQRDAAHRGIDTEAEYRRLSRVCSADQRALREKLRAVSAD